MNDFIAELDVFSIGMETAIKYFSNPASASTFVVKHSPEVAAAARFPLSREEAIEMFENAAVAYRAIENPEPWTIASDLI